ncbi:ParB N-terminal domain-containing protein [Paenibacillus larvae]|nr:ParB N-terminal domain-containing protein [Paenibacillus larvae]
MVNVLSNLELVDIEFIDVHEKCEPKRLTKTVQTIQDDGFIKNSVLAIKIDNRYLIIDGTHRTSALKTLGCRRIPIQVVDPKELKIEYWSHLVPEGIGWKVCVKTIRLSGRRSKKKHVLSRF